MWVSALLPLVAFATMAGAVPCNYARTCISLEATYPPCSPEDAAEFELVQPALQACKDISYFFSEGTSAWPNAPNDKALYCNVNSPCGAIVPYAHNIRDNNLCNSFRSYAGTIQTFAYYCSSQPVSSLPGDNGLLASLKSNAATPKPTPSRTKPTDLETPEPIPNDPTPTQTPSPAPTATKTIPTTTPALRTESPTSANATKDNNADANAKTPSAAGAIERSMCVVAISAALVVLSSSM